MRSLSLERARRALKVGPQASELEIRRAARALARRHHPDLGGCPWRMRVVLRARDRLLAELARREAEERWLRRAG